MPWESKADALFQTWYSGQEEGNALAALLFGDVSPSGKLPVTFGKERSDFPATGNNEYSHKRADHTEGVFVGYRWFEKKKIEPLFPFGHGLSYAEFEYGDLALSTKAIESEETITISYTVKNTGTMRAAEVSQLYVQDNEASVERPPKELKAFAKTFLNPGETRTVSHDISTHDLAFWDDANKKWKVEKGLFTIHVGASSADIRARAELTCTKELTFTDKVYQPMVYQATETWLTGEEWKQLKANMVTKKGFDPAANQERPILLTMNMAKRKNIKAAGRAPAHWTKDSSAVWRVNLADERTLAVTIRYACPPQQAGSKYRIVIKGKAEEFAHGTGLMEAKYVPVNKTLTATVESTGAWETYADFTVGKLKLKRGSYTFTLQPLDAKEDEVFKVHSVTLKN
jgi:hypothetical protein